MASVSGSGNITLPGIGIGRVLPSDSHMNAARALIPAVRTLATGEASDVHLRWAACLLAGQVVECLLRATLSKGQETDPTRQPRLQHDLERLWGMCVEAGAPLPKEAPGWFQTLAPAHKNYAFRYADGLHAMVMPNGATLAAGVEDLARTIEEHLA